MKGLTLTIVTRKIQSINYGETVGNISTLKKLSIGTNYPKRIITYFSDKAIKYDVRRIGREQFGWKLMDNSIVEVFANNYKNGNFSETDFLRDMIKKYEEFDLFGGMFVDIGAIYDKKKKELIIGGKKLELNKEIELEKLKRTQPVRFSNGYSISEFVYDMNLLNDIDAYNRYIKYIAGRKEQSLVYQEEHYSHYTYTLTIDLDRVGAIDSEKDGKIIFEPVVDPAIRIRRVSQVLEIVLFYLNRQIKGRVESLTPIFVIGGVYDVKHPFFANAINFWEENQKLFLKCADITKILSKYSSQNIAANTFLHFDDSFVSVIGHDLQLPNTPIEEIYKSMKQKIYDYYRRVYYEYAEQLIKELEIKGVNVSNFVERLEIIKTKEETLKKEEEMKELINERTQLIKDIKEKIKEG